MIHKNPLVSVIIPTYKRSEMLIDAINSVINQTYDNLEIIVIDDNNPDSLYRTETPKKLKPFIESNQITYLQNKCNIGGALTRNRGIQEARGKYIAFLDDDDYYLPTKIEKQVELIKNENVGLVYCHCNGVDRKGNILWENLNSYEGTPLYESMIYCIASTSLWLCDRQMLLDIGGFEEMPSKQDLLLMVKIIAYGYEIRCVKEKLVNYLEHDKERITKSKASLSIIEGWMIFRSYCRQHYDKLSKKQVKEIEYRFSRTLCLQYIGLKNNRMLLKEYRIMLKNKIFSIGTITMAYRIILESIRREYVT